MIALAVTAGFLCGMVSGYSWGRAHAEHIAARNTVREMRRQDAADEQ